MHSQTDCIILAGGQGTRLFPLTKARCKPAVAFGGRYRLIDIPISHALNAKIENIYIISQYLASSLHQHILETYSLDLFHDSRIHLLSPEATPHQQVWYHGTADAVRQNREHLMASPAEYFLILSGDQLYNMDLHEMIQFAKTSGADLVIGALPVERAEAHRMGILKIDQDQKVLSFVEKPSSLEQLKPFELPTAPSHYLGSMGIYIFKREALFNLLKMPGDDFGKHLIPLQVEQGHTAAFVYQGYWEDIGTILSYYKANLALLSGQNCLNTYDPDHPIFTHPQHLPSPLIKGSRIDHAIISQGSLIEAQEITRSIIGFRVHIQTGCQIRNSIIVGHLDPCSPLFSIGKDCHIEKAIIDEQAHIGNGVRLINQNHLENADLNGIYIRDGIIIVPAGVSVPDHFTL